MTSNMFDFNLKKSILGNSNNEQFFVSLFPHVDQVFEQHLLEEEAGGRCEILSRVMKRVCRG